MTENSKYNNNLLTQQFGDTVAAMWLVRFIFFFINAFAAVGGENRNATIAWRIFSRLMVVGIVIAAAMKFGWLWLVGAFLFRDFVLHLLIDDLLGEPVMGWMHENAVRHTGVRAWAPILVFLAVGGALVLFPAFKLYLEPTLTVVQEVPVVQQVITYVEVMAETTEEPEGTEEPAAVGTQPAVPVVNFTVAPVIIEGCNYKGDADGGGNDHWYECPNGLPAEYAGTTGTVRIDYANGGVVLPLAYNIGTASGDGLPIWLTTAPAMEPAE